MKKNVVVFGMGNEYRFYQTIIEQNYNIIGYCSNNDKERNQFDPYFSVRDLKNIRYDAIVVCTCDDTNVVNQLVDAGVSLSQIILSRFELKNDIFFAQYGEDAIIRCLLMDQGKEIKNVRYVELGTSHPILLNNTYSLYKKGAQGILVEPNPNLRNIIEKYRRNDLLLSAAVGLKHGQDYFYELESDTLSTFNIENLDDEIRLQNVGFQLKDKYLVEILTINEILEKLGGRCDLLSIDIEGLDYEVIQSLEWKRFKPEIIVIELIAWGMKTQKDEEIISYLSGVGYRLVYRTPANGIFVMGVSQQ